MDQTSFLERIWAKPTQISNHFYCSICLEVFRNPFRIKCGHVYCEECLELIINTPNRLCPTDRIKINPNEISRDLLTSEIIDELEVFCPNKKNGCTEVMILKHMENHTSSECKFSSKKLSQWLLDLQEIDGTNDFLQYQYMYGIDDLQDRVNELITREIPSCDLMTRLYNKYPSLVKDALNLKQLDMSTKEKLDFLLFSNDLEETVKDTAVKLDNLALEFDYDFESLSK